MTLTEIRAELHRRANPAKAKVLQRFFKTGPGEYGEGDKFIGITVPELREVVAQAWQIDERVVLSLLRSPIHEERLLALLIWVKQFARGGLAERERIYHAYLQHTRWINNWDLVDSSARDIVGAWLVDKDRSVLYQLVKSTSLWERRIAIIATFHFIRTKDFKDTLALSELLLTDEEDLMHKAVGWMLREVGKRDVAAMESFLIRHQARMPRTMLRYAIEKLPEKQRQEYLRGVAR